MKINKWIMTAAAAGTMLVTSAKADDAWFSQRTCWGPGNGQLFNANELSIDGFGMYKATERHFLAFPNTSIHHGDWGGGLGANYFFCRYLGIGGEAGFISGQRQIADHGGGNVFFRLPIDVIHLAPYCFGGGGRCWNPTDSWYADVGAGVEFRFNAKVGIFGDASYIWKSDSVADQAQLRVGLRLVF